MRTKSFIAGSALVLATASSLFAWRIPAPGQPMEFRPHVAAIDTTSTDASPAESPFDGALESRNVVGLVVPAAQAEVRAKADGVLGAWASEVGQSISAGDTLVALDDQDLKLESMRQAARIEAARSRITAGRARVSLLEQIGQKYAALAKDGAATWAEVAENRCLTEEATQSLHALEQDLSVQEIGAKSIERQLQKLRCTSPLSGQVCEVIRSKDEYVREGEIIARVRSQWLQIIVNLPAKQIEHLAQSTFTVSEGGRMIELGIIGVKGNYNLDGSRAVTLSVPEAGDLVAGQTLGVKVSVK